MTQRARLRRLQDRFGKRLRACRIAAGFEQADMFADMLGIEAQRYRRYERGEAMPPTDVLLDMCEALDKTADFLLFGRTEKP